MRKDILPHYKIRHRKTTQSLLQAHERGEAMSLAVGGHYERIGLLELHLLRACKLQPHHTVVDVGCGSGRLACQLADFLEGPYLGIDVVPELLSYAEEQCARKDWTFSEAPGLSIPVPDGYADYICFFSVFTHLTHEESYRYLEDAKRGLKSEGRIVFSFLEFSIPQHWKIFKGYIENRSPEKVLVQFLDRDAIQAWAKDIGLRVVEIFAADELYIPIPNATKLSDGTVLPERCSLGQSACVLENDR